MIRFQQVSLMRGVKPLLDKVDLLLNPGDKIGLIGANGAGKSSLFGLLRGTLHADQGDLDYPATWRVAHVAQETPALERPAIEYAIDGDVTLRRLEAELAALEAEPESVENGLRMGEIYAALADADAYTVHSRAEQLLTGLGFTQAQMQLPLTSFSGGWRMRLNLAQALMCPSDLLLLDEPTNHLDLATREALSVALNEFEGTVMLVSHDRSLLRAVCDEFWLVSRGGIAPFDGDLDDYQRYLLDVAKQSREAQRTAARAEAAPAPAPVAERTQPDAAAQKALNERLRPLKKELAQLDQRLAALQQEREQLEAALLDPQGPEQLAELGRRLKAVQNETDSVEMRWLELGEAIEQSQHS